MHEINNTEINNGLNKIAILVLSTRDKKYDSFKEAVNNSWMREMQKKGIICYFYEGDYVVQSVVGNTMQLRSKDKLINTGSKLIEALHMLINRYPDVELVYRTNLSSYIDPINFLKYINRKKLGADSYSGVVGKTTRLREKYYGKWLMYNLCRFLRIGRVINFASGSGFFIGINNIKKILAAEADTNLIDDVMVGDVMNIRLNPDEAPLRFDILENNKHKVGKAKYFEMLNSDNLFHYRFKTNDRNVDSKLLENFCDEDFRLRNCVI